MGTKGVSSPSCAHQGDPCGRTDRKHAATHACSQGYQQPLPLRHIRIHRQHGKHHRDIVDNRRKDADHDIGVGVPHVDIHQAGDQFQAADKAEPADTQHNAVEEQQRVPLCAGNLLENLERGHTPQIKPAAKITGLDLRKCVYSSAITSR